MKNKLNTIISFILVIVSIFTLWYIQNKFEKPTEWDDNYISTEGFKKLNKNDILLLNTIGLGNTSLLWLYHELKLMLNLVSATEISLNKYLEEPENKEYIDYLLKVYWNRWFLYKILFSQIIYNPITDQKVKDDYMKIINKNLVSIQQEEKNSDKYNELFNYFAPIVCDDTMIKYPKLKTFKSIYRLNSAFEMDKKEYKNSSCYLLLNGWTKTKLGAWKNLLLITYANYLKNNVNDEEFMQNIEEYQKQLLKVTNLLKDITDETKITEIHRNGALKDNYIWINNWYLKSKNIILKRYYDLKNKDKKIQNK